MKQYEMRIAERQLSLADTLEVLEEGQFITVATVDEDGMPYCTPLSYVVERGAGSFEREASADTKPVQTGETADNAFATEKIDNKGDVPSAAVAAGEQGGMPVAGGAAGNDGPAAAAPTASDALASNTPICRIYVHTTNTYGHKIDDWKRDGRVCGTVANEVEPCYEETFFTSRFATAMAFGRIRRVEDPVAVRKALVALCMKYMPSEKREIGGAIQREFDITDVWCIDVEVLTGKAGRRKNR